MSIADLSQLDWLNSPTGQYLQAKEQALYDQAVFDFFGFNALQMGSLHLDLLRNSRIPNRYHASEYSSPSPNSAVDPQVICCDDFLPLAEMSLDLLLLPHCLEFSERPHQTLREAARVMMPEGHLLISGFNPLSLWGLMAGIKKCLTKNKNYPWNCQFIGLSRLKDWLALLGFEVISVEMYCYVPPFERIAWSRRLDEVDKVGSFCGARFGGSYFIIAKKRVVGMTPLKPNWKAAPLSATLVARQPKSKRTPPEAQS